MACCHQAQGRGVKATGTTPGEGRETSPGASPGPAVPPPAPPPASQDGTPQISRTPSPPGPVPACRDHLCSPPVPHSPAGGGGGSGGRNSPTGAPRPARTAAARAPRGAPHLSRLDDPSQGPPFQHGHAPVCAHPCSPASTDPPSSPPRVGGGVPLGARGGPAPPDCAAVSLRPLTRSQPPSAPLLPAAPAPRRERGGDRAASAARPPPTGAVPRPGRGGGEPGGGGTWGAAPPPGARAAPTGPGGSREPLVPPPRSSGTAPTEPLVVSHEDGDGGAGPALSGVPGWVPRGWG